MLYCTTDLVGKENLLCKLVEAVTIKKYLVAASELSNHSQMMNPTLNSMGSQSKFISYVLHE